MLPKYPYAYPELWICHECGLNCAYFGEDYMLDHSLWLAHAKKKELLCVGCFESRLGRHLTRDDFLANVPINDMHSYFKSARLVRRLSS